MAEDDEKTAGPRALTLRFAGTCRGCGVGLAKGAEAWWWATDRSVECQACHTGTDALTPEPRACDEVSADEQRSAAGGSAQREYERRAARERLRQRAAVEQDQNARVARREARPVLGRLVNALTERPPEPRETQATRAWKVGAAGERRVAEVLDETTCFVLHDRRVPGSKANIDHLAVGPAGVFVIDAKKYEDKRLEVRDKGRLLSPDLRLYVGGRDNTKLVDGVKRQCEVVRDVLGDREVLVRPVLCFVGATWPGLFSNKPLRVGGVLVTWPRDLLKRVTEDGPLSAEQIEEVGGLLAERLSPA
jgi:hypothetical protein